MLKRYLRPHRSPLRALLLTGIVLAMLAALAIIPTQRVSAAQGIPYRINFQGRLTDSTGAARADGLYNMRFRIFNVDTNGSALWTETREVSNRVQLTGGLFTVQLGSVTTLPASVFTAQDLWFEVELPTPATATCSTASCQTWTEGPMTLRSKLASSAYAYNADMIDGIDGSSLARNDAVNTFGFAQYFNAESNFSSFLNATGDSLFYGANSATKFLVRNNSSLDLFKVDSNATSVGIGSSTADANAVTLVLDSSNSASDPTGVAGAMYYNSNLGRFRCFETTWKDCVTAQATLQTAYNNSSSPATITTTAAKGIQVAAGAAPTVDMFTITNAGQGVATAGVSALQVNYTGGSGAIEASGMRVDYTPGGTSGSTWNGLRVAAGNSASGVTSNGIKIEGPTTGNGTDVGLRVASGFDIGIDVGSGGLEMTAMADPATPVMGDLRVYAKTNAGRTMLKMKGGSGIDTSLQPFLGSNRISVTSAMGNSNTTFQSYGGLHTSHLYTSGSTATTATVVAGTSTTSPQGIAKTQVTNGNLFASMRRLGVYSAASAGTAGGLRGTQANFFRGNTGNNQMAGFYVVFRAGVGSYTSGLRNFVGMNANTGAPAASTEPTAQTNAIGFACDSTDNSFIFMSNDTTGAATELPLTGSFPCNTSAIDMYEFRLFSPPGSLTIYFSISRLNTTDYYESSTTTDLPATTQALNWYLWSGTSTATQGGMDIVSIYTESDN